MFFYSRFRITFKTHIPFFTLKKPLSTQKPYCKRTAFMKITNDHLLWLKMMVPYHICLKTFIFKILWSCTFQSMRQICSWPQMMSNHAGCVCVCMCMCCLFLFFNELHVPMVNDGQISFNPQHFLLTKL